VLGFGGSEIGFERIDVTTVRRLLDDALDGGLNVVDTAECYADSDLLIGEAAGRYGDAHLFHQGGQFEGTGRDDWRPASLERSIVRSLARRRTDHVDLLQLHTCSEDDLRRGDVMGAISGPPCTQGD
jgi:aryl-alcohol dehydrogenase-like predicted oxidoreductase